MPDKKPVIDVEVSNTPDETEVVLVIKEDGKPILSRRFTASETYELVHMLATKALVALRAQERKSVLELVPRA